MSGSCPIFFALIFDAYIEAMVLCRALAAGCCAPLLSCPSHESYPHAARVSALGALHAAYVVR